MELVINGTVNKDEWVKMKKKFWLIGLIILIVAIISILWIYFGTWDNERPKAEKRIHAVFKSHLIMYTKGASHIYRGRGPDTEIVKPVGPDERIFVDQPQNGWFPVYPMLVDSIINLEKNLIGYISSKDLITTSIAMREGFVKGLKDKFISEDKNVRVQLENNKTHILLEHPSFDENWIGEFTRSRYFTEIKDLGFSELIISDGRGFKKQWRFE